MYFPVSLVLHWFRFFNYYNLMRISYQYKISGVRPVFHRPIPRNFIPPAEIDGIERVLFAKLLGVMLQPDLGAGKHCDYILRICNQLLYLLSQLKKQGLPQVQLQNVYESIVISRIMYAAPAWSGYVQSVDVNSLEKMLIKAKRWQIVTRDYDIEHMFEDCDRSLFRAARNMYHCLCHLFTIKKQTHSMTMRLRGHDFELPKRKYQMANNSFINRSIFLYV